MSDSESESDVYEVEAIRKRRIFKGKIQYFIKWKNWPENSNTWEDEENLEGCRELLADFLKKQVLLKKEQQETAVKFLKVISTFDSNGVSYVTFLCSDKTKKSMLKTKAVHYYPDLFLDYLESHAAFRVEK